MNLKERISKQKNFLFPFFIVFGLLYLIPVFTKKEFTMNVLILSCIWAILGSGWNFVGGYAGQCSNGHAVFFAIGAYTSAIMLKNWSITPWVAILVGAAISAALAYLIGMLILRLRGPFFAIATMAICECFRYIFLNWKYIGASQGISYFRKDLPELYTLQFISKQPFLYVCVSVLALVVILTKILENTRFGYYCRAIRANQDSAESSGANTSLYKSLAYMLSAAVVSVGGSLYAQYTQYVEPNMLLTLSNSMLIGLVCIMGGVGTVWGPMIGAFIMITIQEYARAAFASVSGLNLVVYGVMVIAIALFLPNGIISLFRGDARLSKYIGRLCKKRKGAAK